MPDASRWANWQAPQAVRLDGEWVEWDFLPEPANPGGADHDQFGFQNLPLPVPAFEDRFPLHEFLALAESEADQIAGFIRRWGPLYLCRHNMPMTHWPYGGERSRRRGRFCAHVFGDGASNGREPIRAYRTWAAMGRAIIAIQAELMLETADRFGRPEDWARVAGEAQPASRSVAIQKVQGHLNLWLALGLVQPMVSLDASPHYRLAGYGIFGAIALELGRAVIASGIALCAACGRAFTLTNQPRQGEDAYCPEPECKLVRNARAAGRSRRRQRETATSDS